MREVTSIPEVMKGSVMHRLFQRAFPGFFPYNSLHLWQPFHIPAINYVLAKKQEVSADLESLSEMGLPPQTLKDIADLEKAQNDEKNKFYDSTISPSGASAWTDTLKNLEKNHKVGYTALEKTQINEAMKIATKMDSAKMKDAKEEAEGFAKILMAFKPLKRAIRMPDSRFKIPKATAIHVTSYDTVKEILDKQPIFKNPGYLDSQSIPDGPLRAILTGKPDKKLGMKIETAMSKIREMVDQSKEELFMRYFSEKAESYRKLDSRKFQVVKSAQVYQLDIVSEYVTLLNILRRLRLRFTNNEPVLPSPLLLNS